ncbi:hypothetical protein HMPREF0653_00755 [Prevotella disiens JCM 6334 = ATCC 29426]|uniref:Uncharacterized protein n=1 Tax=Prevotella disiens JCM 6334 = ATCC 29426 TaxID=1235811 RepID=A0ABP2Y938_9BACT|nr:hypothetical protein HMPREF0653_00755 [Prevotella disiens JCM 6334 = ATCC 29426]
MIYHVPKTLNKLKSCNEERDKSRPYKGQSTPQKGETIRSH